MKLNKNCASGDIILFRRFSCPVDAGVKCYLRGPVTIVSVVSGKALPMWREISDVWKEELGVGETRDL
jgi:hypothetical protein